MKSTLLSIALTSVAALTARTASQTMDLGPVAKNTWAASDPHNCVKFFTEFLGDQVVPAPTPGCPDGQCDCGIRGQTTLMNVSSAADGGGGFGLHTVNCQHHPTGSMSLEDFEHGIMHQVQNLRKPVNAAMLDLNMGLWARSLAPYIKKLNDAKTPFYATKWVDAESGETIYSITVRACGVVMLQLISNDVTSDVEGHVMLPTFKSVNPRMKFQQWNGPGGNVFPKKNMRENALPMGVSSPPAGSLLPIKISRPTTHARLDEIKDYYTSLFGASVLERTTFDDGSTVLTLLMPRQEDVSKGEIPSYGVHLQFWAHNDTFVSQTAEYLVKTNQRIVSPTCGMSKWLDYHFAALSPNTSAVVEGLKSRDVSFHWAAGAKGSYNVYTYDPSGFGVEVVSSPLSTAEELARQKNMAPPQDTLPPICWNALSNGTCPSQEAGQCT